MLDASVGRQLLAVAESEPDVGVRLHVVRSLVQLGLDQAAWKELESRVLRLVELPGGDPGRADALQLLGRVPTAGAASRLKAIADDPQDPDAFVAARALDSGVQCHVPELVERLQESLDVTVLRTLACLSLERYEVDVRVFEAALSAESAEARLWAAIASAKLGSADPLRRQLGELSDEPPEFMWGDPWSSYDTVAAAAPVPAELRERLAAWWEDLQDRDARLVIGALTGRWDAEGSPVVQMPPPPEPYQPPAAPPLTDDERRRRVDRIVSAARARDLELLFEADLAAAAQCDAGEQGAVVTELLSTVAATSLGQDGWVWGNAAMKVVAQAQGLDLPVRDLLSSYLASPESALGRSVLATALSRTDVDATAATVAELMAGGDTVARRSLADLLDSMSWGVASGEVPTFGAGPSGPPPPLPVPDSALAPADPPPAPVEALPSPAPAPAYVPPPSPAGPPPAPAPVSAGPPPASAPPPPGLLKRISSVGRGWFKKKPAARTLKVTIGGEALDLTQATDAQQQQLIEEFTDMQRPVVTAYTAWPLLAAPDVVVARTTFEVTAGLDEFYDPGAAVTGQINVESPGPQLDFEVEIVVDPVSFAVDGPVTASLAVTASTPYPKAVFSLSALTAPGLLQQRTLRLLFRREGRIVGIAARNVVVVTAESQVAGAPAPEPIGGQMLDLAPLLDDDPPDLVVCVYEADEPGTYVWDAYPLDHVLHLPDLIRRSAIDGSARDFATFTRRTVSSDQFRGLGAFDQLKGYGDLVQSTIPPGVRQVLRDLASSSAEAPSVLFLTEEAFVPWELAVLDPPLTTTYGGDSPFLGAHLAMSRWPFASQESRPAPPARLEVVVQGVLTAAYDGVQDWKRLPAAEAEAVAFDQAYGPTTTVLPRREDVIDCLEGRVALDLLHVALHGQYDPASQEDGLILLEPDGDGFKASFLTSTAVRGFRNATKHPFVFLNACQVGAGDHVLGSYAGFAAALLRTGASGVVAPLWNIDDDVAAGLTKRFYDAAYGPDAVPVAEMLRRFRAAYLRDAVKQDPKTITPTYLAYQFFGHPRFVLARTTSANQPPGG